MWRFHITPYTEPLFGIHKSNFLYDFSGEKTACEALQARSNNHFIGAFTPECNVNGNFKSVQCWGAIGQCWCVDSDGNELEGTRAQGKRPDCSAGKCNIV